MFKELLLEAANEGVFSQASLAVYFKGDWKYYNIGDNSVGKCFEIDEFSIYDCASVTKTIPTGVLALQLIDEKKVSIDQRVKDYIPELTMKAADQITLKHLLTHTLDYSFSLGGLKDLSAEEIWQRLMTWEFPSPPGEKYLYCNSTSVLLGVFIERLLEKPLSEIANERIFEKLNLSKTSFDVSVIKDANVVPTEIDSWRSKTLIGEVHDESASVLKAIMVPGSAGLFSCTSDLSKMIDSLMQTYLRGKVRPQLLSTEVLEWAMENHTPNLDVEVALGFERNQSKFMGDAQLGGVIGKTGFTGSCIVMAPQEEKAFVLLTNYTWPKRKVNSNQINNFRSKVANRLWNIDKN